MKSLTITASALAVALSTLVTPAFAQSTDAAAFEELLGAPQPFDNYPKPWPLRNLVKEGVLTIGTTGTSPPRTFVDPKTGELTGAYVALFTKLAEDMGLKAEFVQIEWAGVLPGLAANRFDIACDGASWNPERLGSEQFLMTAPTSLNATVGLTLKSSGITSFEDAGYSLGGVRGEVYFEGAKKKLPDHEAVEFPGMQESFLGLQNGQADVVAVNLSNAMTALQNSPIKDDLKIIGPALEVFPQSLCVNPKQPDLLVAVNTLLGNYRADGSLAEMVGRFGASSAEVDLLSRIGY